MILLRLIISLGLVFCALYTDIKTFKISNRCVIAGLVAGCLLLLKGELKEYLLGFIVGFSVMFLLYVVGAIGAGDVKLMAVLGLLLGKTLIMDMIPICLVTGLFIGIIEIVVKTGKKDSRGFHRFHFSISIALGFLGGCLLNLWR